MRLDSRYEHLVELMEAFIRGLDRSQRLVRDLEGEFAQLLDEDEGFEDLQYALAMFGADGYDMEDRLVKECTWALKTLRCVCVYLDCHAAIEEKSRFCPLHQL